MKRRPWTLPERVLLAQLYAETPTAGLAAKKELEV